MANQYFDDSAGGPAQYQPGYPWDRTGSPTGGFFGGAGETDTPIGGGYYNPTSGSIMGSPTNEAPPGGVDVDRNKLLIESDSASKSYSGLFPWGNKMVKKATKPFFGKRMGSLQGGIDSFLGDMGGRIENARQGEVRQYQRDFRDPLNRAQQGGMLRGAGSTGAAGGGMLGSAFADSMARISEQGNRAAERVHESANVRAEERQQQAIRSNIQNQMGGMGMLNQTLGLSRHGTGESQGSSINPMLFAQMLGIEGVGGG
jgi:hypothetical protein